MVKKYIESHWLVFVAQGVIALIFGWFVMFTGIDNVRSLIPVVSLTILCLGIIQTVNLWHRERNQHGHGLTMLIAFMDIVAALSLLLTMGQNPAWQLVIIACYTLIRGVLEILLALFSIYDATDRFIWLVCGICGAVLGFVIFNSGHFTETTTFIKFFGSYMMIFGVSSLVFGVHSHNEKIEDEKARQAARHSAGRSLRARLPGRKSANSPKKSTVTTSVPKSAKSTKSSKSTKSAKQATPPQRAKKK